MYGHFSYFRLLESVPRFPLSGHLGLVVAVVFAFATRQTFAQPLKRGPAVSEPRLVAPDPTQPYWSQSRPRLFLSGRALAGLGYGRLALSAGYGKPHFIWAGPEAIGIITPYFAAAQGGALFSVAVANLSLTFRRTASFSHALVTEKDSVSSSDLTRNHGRARYSVFDASLWGFVPYQPWLLSWEVTYVKPVGLVSDTLVFEEVQRVVVSQRGVFTTKISPMVRVLPSDRLYVGIIGEQLSLLGRAKPWVARLGPSAWARLTNHLELFTYLSWPFESPDHLGFWNGMYGTVGALYRFASGDPSSKFP